MKTIYGFGILLLADIYVFCALLSHPSYVIFDEVHYASICMLYNQHLFHLDEQPPLFRMILCKTLPDDLFQPGFWSHIGKELTPTIANNSRLFPVACAILLSLGMYIFIFILTKSHFSALISGLLVACDNGIVVQSRMMASDSFYLLNQLLSVLLILDDSTISWILSPFFMGFALSTNWTAACSWILVICISFYHAWVAFIQSDQNVILCIAKGVSVVLWSVLVPVAIHIFVVYHHLQQVPVSGPHASMMSSAFQASLLDGLKSSCKTVRYGSTLKLRANDDILVSGFCYLSNQPSPTSSLYDDDLSLVTCDPLPSQLSYWQVVHPRNDTSRDSVLGGDVVWIKHSASGAFLRSFDFAAPLSQHHRAVSCPLDELYDDDESSRGWLVEPVGVEGGGGRWRNLHDYILLKHRSHQSYLVSTGRKLPFSDNTGFEVVSKEREWFDPHLSLWNAEVVDGAFTGCEESAERMSEWMRVLEFLTFRSRLSDFHSVQPPQDEVLLFYPTSSRTLKVASLRVSSEDCGDHRFSSSVFDWPLARASIGYWRKKKLKAQLHFTGNVVSWCGGLASLCLLTVYWLVVALARKRRIYIVSEEHWQVTSKSLSVCGGGWLLHMIYFTFRSKSCGFTYEYLSAVVYLHAAQGCLAHVLLQHRPFLATAVISAYVFSVFKCYYDLRPLTYGFPNFTSLDDVKYWDTWELFEM